MPISRRRAAGQLQPHHARANYSATVIPPAAPLPLLLVAGGGPRAHRYRADSLGRPGAFILTADGPAGYGTRDKLVCLGRKHPRYERVVTSESAERAYHAAVTAGRTRICLSEI